MKAICVLSGITALVFSGAAPAQVPNALLYSIPAPPAGFQSGANLGCSVAVEGDYAVIGAPYDDLLEHDSGVVKVFHSASGALLHVLTNPSPAPADAFGRWVGISGTRVVVGADGDGTGAYRTGSAYVYDLGSATPTVPVVTLNNPSPEEYEAFGISVSISGTLVVVGASGDNTGATYAGSAYVYDLSGATPTAPLATLNNPAPATGDYFGISVAISGTRVVVGASRDDTGAGNAGIAYVYDLNSATPTVPVATLYNPGPAVNDQFGVSVAISGTRVAVGAWGDDTSAPEAGAAYVYDLSSGTPTVPVATLNNPSPGLRGYFGYSVAISGALVLVGADADHTPATSVGSEGIAYVYDLSSGTPALPAATLHNPSPSAGDAFGRSVAVCGTRMVVGAPYDDTGALDAGTAYGYDFVSETPAVPVATMNHPGPAPGDYFGNLVAISGMRLAVGAPNDDTAAGDAGSVHIYDLSNGTPTVPIATMNDPHQAPADWFGSAVAISGTQVVVGAVQDDTGATDAGSAYVYDLSSGTPTVPVTTLNNPGPAAGDAFGKAVAISGTRVVVGAPHDDTGAEDAGSVYVYDLSTGTPTGPVATLNNPSPEAGDSFGLSVAISGTRVVVGAGGDNTGAARAGSAYVYDLNSATPTVPVTTLNNPSPAVYDDFGAAVAISGAQVVVGAFLDDTGAYDAGSAYVYDLSSGTPAVPVLTLNNPDPNPGDNFGISVTVSGTRVVVGACYDDAGAGDAGSAYVYDLSSGTPSVPVATLHNPDAAVNDLFGTSVAIDGTTVAIGTPFDDAVASDKGAVYVYGPASSPTDGDNDGLPDSWELTYWPATAGHGSLDDFDHDGYPELLELAFGLNPTLPNAGGLPPVTDEGGFLTISIPKHSGVTYQVESAGTLLPARPDSFNSTTTTVLIDNATTLKVRDNVQIGASPARFMRTKVTAAP